MRIRASLDFCLNGEAVSVAGERPARTLLTWLREAPRPHRHQGRLRRGRLRRLHRRGRRARRRAARYRAVNACILFAGRARRQGADHRRGPERDGALHPVQQAMVECHGSQCGFCTPGFVMSLFALYKRAAAGARARRRARRQPLPLHRLPADRRRRRRMRARRSPTTEADARRSDAGALRAARRAPSGDCGRPTGGVLRAAHARRARDAARRAPEAHAARRRHRRRPAGSPSSCAICRVVYVGKRRGAAAASTTTTTRSRSAPR